MGKKEWYMLIADLIWNAIWGVVGVTGAVWAWWFFGVGVIVFIIFVARAIKAKSMGSPADILARIEHRKAYLPQLQDSIEKILIQQKKLAIEAGETGLNTYYDLYIKGHHDIRYRFYRRLLPENLAITEMLLEQKFGRHNPYLRKLEEMDKELPALYAQYETFYTRNSDRTLRGYIRKLWVQTYKTYSVKSMVSITRNKAGLNSKYISQLYNAEPKEDERLYTAIIRVKNRIEELLRTGVPDE